MLFWAAWNSERNAKISQRRSICDILATVERSEILKFEVIIFWVSTSRSSGNPQNDNSLKSRLIGLRSGQTTKNTTQQWVNFIHKTFEFLPFKTKPSTLPKPHESLFAGYFPMQTLINRIFVTQYHSIHIYKQGSRPSNLIVYRAWAACDQATYFASRSFFYTWPLKVMLVPFRVLSRKKEERKWIGTSLIGVKMNWSHTTKSPTITPVTFVWESSRI